MMKVEIILLNENATMPEYKTSGAAGFDICASHGAWIDPNEYCSIDTGLAFCIPEGYELEIRSRSGLAFKHKVFAYNGTIDSDYRGEVKVMLHNGGDWHYTVEKGDRIAQGVIKPIIQAEFVVVEKLNETERGEGGFGSTGL
jgi:dUTP pyrophosphatase